MKISGFNVKNKFICYENLSFDLSKKGIYKISGENGTGKTSIMEQIVFGKYAVEFDNWSYFELWRKCRYALFTYIPQMIIDNNLTVGEYICRGNREIKTGDAVSLLAEFDLDDDIISKKFKVLSGGEKKKIQIISGLLKDTPYIFIDEPTNNLDNIAVAQLNRILADLKDKKIIVLISHDDRLLHHIDVEYLIDGKNMEDTTFEGIEVTDEKEHTSEFLTRQLGNKPNFLKILAPILKNYGQIFTVIVLSCAFALFALYTNYAFADKLDTNIPMQQENVIYMLTFNEFDEATSLPYYIKGEHINIDDSLKNRYLSLNDIYDLSKLEEIEKIYMIDRKYEYEIKNMVKNGTIGDELHFLAFPRAHITEVFDAFISGFGLELEDGQFPEDEKDEVAISKKLLCKFFGYTEENVSNAIGDSISLYAHGTEKKYKIVGFAYYDYAIISYNEDYNFGLYRYNESTFKEFGDNQIQYEINNEFLVGIGAIDTAIILTVEGYESKVLDYLITHYPAGQFSSHYYDVVSIKTYNMQKFNEVLVPNLIIAPILAVAFVFINHFAIRYNYTMLWDYGNYYINRKKMRIIYNIVSFSIYLLLVGIAVLVNSLCTPYYYLSNWYLLIDSSIILIPLFVSYFIRKGKWKF